MKKHGRKLGFALLAAAFLSGMAFIVLQLLHYKGAAESYDQAQQIAFSNKLPETQSAVQTTLPVIPGETEAPAQHQETIAAQTEPTVPEMPMDEGARLMQQIDIYGLRQVNPEVLGWIYLPDTVISYPLMKTDERDKYLHLSWDGKKNASGSIFLEKNNRRDFSDFNTIIYGHHLANGTMFQPLLNYKEEDFANGHPYIYIATDTQIYRYRVFSAYEAPVDSDTYRLYFPDEAACFKAIAWYLQGNENISLSAEDRILTLSTCTGTGRYTTRWVVQAVMDAQWEK